MQFMAAYTFQSIVFLYLLQGITFVDNIGVCTLNESLLHLNVVAHKFSLLRAITDGKRNSKKSTNILEYQELIACIKEHQKIYE